MKIQILSLPKTCNECVFKRSHEDRGHGYNITYPVCLLDYYVLRQGQEFDSSTKVHDSCKLTLDKIVRR